MKTTTTASSSILLLTTATYFFLLAFIVDVSHGFMVAPPIHVSPMTTSKNPTVALVGRAAGQCSLKPYNGPTPSVSRLYSTPEPTPAPTPTDPTPTPKPPSGVIESNFPEIAEPLAQINLGFKGSITVDTPLGSSGTPFRNGETTITAGGTGDLLKETSTTFRNQLFTIELYEFEGNDFKFFLEKFGENFSPVGPSDNEIIKTAEILSLKTDNDEIVGDVGISVTIFEDEEGSIFVRRTIFNKIFDTIKLFDGPRPLIVIPPLKPVTSEEVPEAEGLVTNPEVPEAEGLVTNPEVPEENISGGDERRSPMIPMINVSVDRSDATINFFDKNVGPSGPSSTKTVSLEGDVKEVTFRVFDSLGSNIVGSDLPPIVTLEVGPKPSFLTRLKRLFRRG